MATNHIFPEQPEQLLPREEETRLAAEALAQEKRDWQQHNARLTSSTALVIIAGTVVLVVCYLAKLVLVTLMISIVLAFVLEPVVRLLERIRLPRSVGALVAVLLLMGAGYSASHFFYYRAHQLRPGLA